MNIAYERLLNKLSMKNTRHIALKNSNDFVGVIEGKRKYYGGDQSWYYWQDDGNKGAVAIYSGCASVAVANVFAYIIQNHDKYQELEPYKSLNKADYLEFMRRIYDYVQPLKIFGKSFGVGSSSLMKKRLMKLADAYDLDFEINSAEKYNNFSYLVKFISSALEQDLPLMMLIGRNGKDMEVYYEDSRITKGEFMYHWITITELIVDYNAKEAILRCSTWGRSAYIRLKDFMKFEILRRGLLYIS